MTGAHTTVYGFECPDAYAFVLTDTENVQLMNDKLLNCCTDSEAHELTRVAIGVLTRV